MNRRRAAVAVVTSLVVAGVIPLTLGSASAAACPSWTDAAGDSGVQNPVTATGVPDHDPSGLSSDDDLDIVRVSLAVAADGGVTASVTVKALTAAGPDFYPGDYFLINFSAGGTASNVGLRRDDFAGKVRRATIKGTTTVVGKPPVYDIKASTVTATFSADQVKSAFGKPLTGVALSGFTALSYGYTDSGIYDSPTTVGGLGFPLSDQAPAPTTLTYTDAGGCGDGGVTPAPTGSATPTGTPSATPSGSPTATPSGTPSSTPTGTPGTFEEAPYASPRVGCQLLSDPTGDGTAVVAGPVFPNDSDLDVTSVAVKTTATQLQVLAKIATLGDKPANPQNGDRFEVTFKLGGKTFAFGAGRQDTVATTAAAPSANRNTVNGTADTKLKLTPTFDKTKSTVTLAIDRAALEVAAGVPAPVGTALTGFAVKTYGYFGNRESAADTAQAAAAADQVYNVGDNACFFPPAAAMEWLGEDTVVGQYGDLVEAAVALSSEDGVALEGRVVTFTLGTVTVTGTTDADGVADVFLPALVSGNVIAAFAGEADYYKTALEYPVTVTPEVTKLTLAVTKAGTARTVTATLVDDDKPKANPVASQVLTVFVNGKKAGTVKTDAKGKAVWKTAKAGQTVKFTLAAVPGKYAAASAQQKLA